MGAFTVSAWMALNSAPMTPPSASPLRVRFACGCFTFYCLIMQRWSSFLKPLCVEEEPYLIFANRYYLRKLNLDGSNYTLIKQVRFGLCWTFLRNSKVMVLWVYHTPLYGCFCSRVWIMQWRWTSTTQSRWSTGQMWPPRAVWSDAWEWMAATWRSVNNSFLITGCLNVTLGVCLMLHTIWSNRFYTGPLWVTRMAWQWIGLLGTCTGVIKAGTPSRCQNSMGPIGLCYSTTA